MATVTGYVHPHAPPLGTAPAAVAARGFSQTLGWGARFGGLGTLPIPSEVASYLRVPPLSEGIWALGGKTYIWRGYHTGFCPDGRAGGPEWTATTIWADRFWVFPIYEDIKTIINDTQGYFQLISTFRETPQTLQGVTISGAGFAGTFIEQRTSGTGTFGAAFGAISIPRLFNPRSSQTYRYTVLGEGEPDIDIIFEFDLVDPTVQHPLMNVVGNRALLFPFIPQNPVHETLSFLTDVIEAHDGTEQRISTRTGARQMFGMEYFLTDPDRDEKFQLAQSLAASRGGRTLGVGMWHQARKLTADAPIGALTIYMDTSDLDFRVGGFFLLYDEWNITEIGKILSFTPTSITLNSALTKNFSVESYCVPMQLCVAKDGLSLNERLVNLSTFDVEWESTEVTNTLADPTSLYSETWAPPSTTYGLIPVVNDPNFVGKIGLTSTLTHSFDTVDKKTGPIKYLNRKLVPAVSFSKTWETQGRTAMSDAMDLRKFLYWAKGKLRSFWIASSTTDFTIVDDVLTGAAQIVVKPSDYDKVGINAPYDHIQIQYTASSGLPDTYHRIENILKETPTVATDTLTLSHGSSAVPLTGFASGFNAADVEYVQFLYRARLDSDKFKITHNGQGITKVAAPIRGIKQ